MITVEQYESAIKNLSNKRKEILIKLYSNGPFDDTTYIADLLGYPNINSANLQIGNIGVAISKETGVKPSEVYEYKGEEKLAYFSLVHGYFENGWDLVENLQIALENLGLVDNLYINDNIENLETEISKDEIKLYKEGKLITVFVNKYERDKKLREECLNLHKRICSGCQINFKEVYGNDIPDIIHVHHIKPLSEIKTEEYKNPLNDLVPLCPNCHAVVHSLKDIITIEDLKNRINNYYKI